MLKTALAQKCTQIKDAQARRVLIGWLVGWLVWHKTGSGGIKTCFRPLRSSIVNVSDEAGTSKIAAVQCALDSNSVCP
jgi:hypothetical protein